MSAHSPDVPGAMTADDPSRVPAVATAAESEEHAVGRIWSRRLEGVGTFVISLLDVGMAALAWNLAHAVRIGLAPQLGPLIPFTSGSEVPPWLPQAVFLAIYALALYGNGCMSSERPLWVLRRQLLAGVGALFVFLVLSYLFKWLTVSRAFLGVMAVALPVAIVVEWFVIRAFRKTAQRWGVGINRVLVAGDTLSASWVLHDLERNASWGVRAAGLVSDDPAVLDSKRRNVFNVQVVPDVSQLASWVVRLRADQVVLCLPDISYAELAALLQTLWGLGVRVYVLRPELSVHLGTAEEPQSLFRGTELVDYGASRNGRLSSPQKRAFDLLAGTLLLALSLPVMAAIALAVLVADGRPILHRQVRVGHRGRRFTIWKFRTMKVGAEHLQSELMTRNEAVGPMFKIRKDPRLTPLGTFLRRHSLDELPQLTHVVAGEMSLVGPRPPLPAEVERYQPWHHARLSGVIGCSGLWQVSGRSDLPFDEMVMLDLYYLRHSSLRLDFKILTRTLWVVLVGEGAY